MTRKPHIVGIWRDDPQKVMQAYEFVSWAAALDFCRRNRKDFSLRYHVLLAEA